MTEGYHVSTNGERVRNIRSSNPVRPRPGRVLLRESDGPALRWWDHERNNPAEFATVTVLARRRAHWLCPDCGLRFTEVVAEMTQSLRCPACAEQRAAERTAVLERWRTTAVADVPQLLAAWADPEHDPRHVMVTGNAGYPLMRFRCASGHHPRLEPLTFLEAGCPHCRAIMAARSNPHTLAVTLPEIAAQWHPDRNGKLTPDSVPWDSKRTVWWRTACCGHEWQAPIRSRDKHSRLLCPSCETILGSLAWQDPGLAAEWSPANPLSAWHVRPHGATSFTPQWVCATDTAHRWQASLSSRASGAECPECRQAGKSRVELDHHAAAVAVFSAARSGVTLRSPAFTTRKVWTADIAVRADERIVVIEYDGAYWHRAPAKVAVDQRKTADLLAAGHVVVRLREVPLPALDVQDPRYLEVSVHSAAPRPVEVMQAVRDWVTQAR